MKSMKRILSIALFTLSASCAYAQQAEEPAKQAATVPKLNIVWDCGACEVNEKVAPLIEKAFQEAALKHGKSVSATESVEAKIHQFRQRPPGVRVMFGVMAGKDRLGMKISYKGQEIPVGDYSANAVQGMNALCESVGKEAFQKILALLE